MASPDVFMIRREDFLTLAFQFINLEFSAEAHSEPSLVRKDPSKDAFVIVSFPPQSIAELAFFETDPNLKSTDPSGMEPVALPPVPGILSGGSRIVLKLTPRVSALRYRLDALLDWSRLDLVVAKNALFRKGTVTDVIKPENPLDPGHAPVTAIEAPYRLFLSPHDRSVWSHAREPVSSKKRYELWHTELTAPNELGLDLNTVRAIWSPELVPPPEQIHPTPFPPHHFPILPFRMSLDQRDRLEIVRLSSEFGMKSSRTGQFFQPLPMHVERFMLSSLGAWMNIHGAWEPPSVDDLSPTGENGHFTFTIENWRHRATMARDHFVRVVYKGYLFPFGHRASLVKVTERKFERGPGGVMQAYLKQRMFIIVREPEKVYTDISAIFKYRTREFPFTKVRITTLVTPNLDNPLAGINNRGQDAFWPKVGGTELQFHMIGTDREGQTAEFTAPVIFVSPVAFGDSAIGSSYAGSPALRTSTMGGQKIAFARHGQKAGDTSLEVFNIVFSGETFAGPFPAGITDQPPFYPSMQSSNVRLTAVSAVAGNTDAVPIQWHQSYLDNPNPPHGVFLRVNNPINVKFSGGQADKSGGFITPDLSVSGLSWKHGAVGDVDKLAQGKFDPEQFFSGAKLLGGLMLHSLIEGDNAGGGALPRFTTEALGPDTAPTGVRAMLSFQPKVKNFDSGFIDLTWKNIASNPLTLDATIDTFFASKAPSSRIAGTLKDFDLLIADVILVPFKTLSFLAQTGKKLDTTADLGEVEFKGALEFINELSKLIPGNGLSAGPSIDVTSAGLTVSTGLSIPDLTFGVFSLTNMAFSAGLNLPFTGEPVRLRFAFCERQSPFVLTVAIFGGGGFFGIAVGPDGVELLEASFEFGGNFSLNLGIASGGVHVMAGIYFKVESNASQLTGYVRIGGSVDILGLISISVELYLALGYATNPKRAWGEATLSIDIHIIFFSISVDISVRREFKDPPISAGELATGIRGASASDPAVIAAWNSVWEQYCEAFA